MVEIVIGGLTEAILTVDTEVDTAQIAILPTRPLRQLKPPKQPQTITRLNMLNIMEGLTHTLLTEDMQSKQEVMLFFVILPLLTYS